MLKWKQKTIKNENTFNKITLNPIESDEIRLNKIFKDFLIYTQNFNENEKHILTKLFSNKNEFILSALELFEKEGDEIEFVDSLNIALKIQEKNCDFSYDLEKEVVKKNKTWQVTKKKNLKLK